jgi:hypothetical protein
MVAKAPDFTIELKNEPITPIELWEGFLQTTIVLRFVSRIDLRQCCNGEPCVC